MLFCDKLNQFRCFSLTQREISSCFINFLILKIRYTVYSRALAHSRVFALKKHIMRISYKNFSQTFLVNIKIREANTYYNFKTEHSKQL